MPLERLTPIVGPDGKPYYVTERDYIGAEHVNAQAAWTRTHHAVATLEHDEEGLHNQWGIPRAFIALFSGDMTRRIEPESRSFGVTYRDDPTIIQATALGGFRSGETRITLSRALPSMDYSLMGYSGGSRATKQLGATRISMWRVFLTSRISTSQFDIKMEDGISAAGFDMTGPIAFAVVC